MLMEYYIILATTAEILRKWYLTSHEDNKMIDMINIRYWNDKLSFTYLLKIDLRLENDSFPNHSTMNNSLTNRPAISIENISK